MSVSFCLPHAVVVSEQILPRLTHHTLAQLRTNKSPFLKSYIHKVDPKTHPSPLFPLCNIHTHDTHHLFNCTHIRTTLSPLDLWTDLAGGTALLARWTEKLAGGPQAGISDSPLARVMGVGRQQQVKTKEEDSWAIVAKKMKSHNVFERLEKVESDMIVKKSVIRKEVKLRKKPGRKEL